ELKIRAAVAGEIKCRRTGRASSIKLGSNFIDRQVVALPAHVAGHAVGVEFQPMERAAFDLKVQIRVRFIVGRNDAVDPGGRRSAETVRVDGEGNLGADGTGDDLRIERAETVREVKLLRANIDAQASGAAGLGAALDVRVGEEEEPVGVTERR